MTATQLAVTAVQLAMTAAQLAVTAVQLAVTATQLAVTAVQLAVTATKRAMTASCVAVVQRSAGTTPARFRVTCRQVGNDAGRGGRGRACWRGAGATPAETWRRGAVIGATLAAMRSAGAEMARPLHLGQTALGPGVESWDVTEPRLRLIPFTPADIDRLRGWIRSPEELRLWTASRADAGAIQRRREVVHAASGETIAQARARLRPSDGMCSRSCSE